MRYLFFDIEGANCYNFKSKMCTFGYVMTTPTFDVFTKIDVVINPESTFDKHIIKNKMNAYDISKYEKAPAFPYFYNSIKNILEFQDQIIVGWSIENDVKYVYDACKRYNLKQIKYQYLDLQKVVMKIENTTNHPGLDTVCKKYNIEEGTYHKSDDDALITMKIAQIICKEKKVTLQELCDLFSDCVSSVDEFILHLPSAEEIQEKINKRRVNDIIKNAKRKQKHFNPAINENDIFAFHPDIIKGYYNQLVKVIYYIKECGAECVTTMSKCTKFIYIKEPKRKSICHNENQEVIEMIKFEDFLKAIDFIPVENK